MNAIETRKTRLICPTCGTWEVTSALKEQDVKYFAVQRDVEKESVVTISKAICRTCASAAIIQEQFK